MAKLDKQIKLRPNATHGFTEVKVIVTPDFLKDIDKLPEKAFTVESPEKAFTVSRRMYRGE